MLSPHPGWKPEEKEGERVRTAKNESERKECPNYKYMYFLIGLSTHKKHVKL